jgi:primosomal protein N' (replication factor Y) (superfamily II helicase)
MPTVFVEVVVNVPQVRGVFHYHLPPELEENLGPGHFVLVPFGKQTVQGVILERLTSTSVAETRPVLALLETNPVLTPEQISLARNMAENSLSPLAACIDLMLPPGLSQHTETTYSLAERAASTPGENLSTVQRRLLKLLERRGPLRTSQLERALPNQNWRAAVQGLAKQGLGLTETTLPTPAVRPKVVRTARLACPHEVAEASLDHLGRPGSEAVFRRQKMLRFLMDEGGPVEVSWVYASSAGNLADLRYLAEKNLVILGESETWRDPLEGLVLPSVDAVRLTDEQKIVWERIAAALQTGDISRPFLLFGVTGSGKTEIYLQAVEAVLAEGKQVIVMVPEIALTPQTVRRFMVRFPGRVGLVHSRLSPGERYDTWRRARSGLISLVVGPRSALFTPFQNIGLIIVDESHDESYYQAESPAFHARDLAEIYARQTGALCILGTATPDIVTYFAAEKNRLQLLKLPDRILGHRKLIQAQAQRLQQSSRFRPYVDDAETIDLPPVQVVDMRVELREGNRSIFSRSLQAALAEVLAQNQQAILFLNRRGSATYVFCRDCGYALRCPRCDLPLTLHAAQGDLLCHTCGYRRGLPAKCPQCGSTRIRQYGTGTEKVEAEVRELFPGARTLRWDRSTTGRKDAHEAILSHFVNHRADILVGTQMLAKGLDLPLVTLVGVVLADVGLNLPDFRAAERVFQVLTQVAGRAGRSLLGGRVVLQTFMPEHYAIQAAAAHNYQAFYAQELVYRRKLGYPPFSRLVRLEMRGPDARKVEADTRALAGKVQAWIKQANRQRIEIIGPVPCFFNKVAGTYRWQIVLRGPDPAALLRGFDLGQARVEVNPPSLL